jgi:hypothetical protein
MDGGWNLVRRVERVDGVVEDGDAHYGGARAAVTQAQSSGGWERKIVVTVAVKCRLEDEVVYGSNVKFI